MFAIRGLSYGSEFKDSRTAVSVCVGVAVGGKPEPKASVPNAENLVWNPSPITQKPLHNPHMYPNHRIPKPLILTEPVVP